MTTPTTTWIHAFGLGELLREHRTSRGDQLAIVDGDRRLTYSQLDERVNRLANALAAAGVGQGGRVVWMGQNSYRVLELLLAVAKLGAILCPANWRQSAEELAFVVDDLDPALVVWQEEEIGERVRAAQERTTASTSWVRHDTDDPESYEALVAAASPEDPGHLVDPALPVLAMYTAAFEGRPNAALLTHTAVLMQDLVVGRVQDITDGSAFLAVGPLFHIATFTIMTSTFHHGGKVVFSRRADGDEMCRLIDTERCTHGFLVEQVVERIREANRDGSYDLGSMWTSPDASEWRNPMVAPASSAWAARPGGYGQTEAMGMFTLASLTRPGEGRAGRAAPAARAAVVDEDGREVAPGESGEIVVRGPLVMAGYHDRPDLNADRFRHGWHHTHDIGRREPDGTLTFVGPKTTLIKSAAENIYPVEVERCIAGHPAVAEVCVIGVPDPTWTQSVKAVVVAEPGSSVGADEIIEHCAANIASYKKPRIVEFTDALPRADGGAVDRAAVDEMFGGGGYPGRGS